MSPIDHSGPDHLLLTTRYLSSGKGDFRPIVIGGECVSNEVPGSLLLVAPASMMWEHAKEAICLAAEGLFLSAGAGDDWAAIGLPYIVNCLRAQLQRAGSAFAYVYATPCKPSMSRVVCRDGWQIKDEFEKPQFLDEDVGSVFAGSDLFGAVDSPDPRRVLFNPLADPGSRERVVRVTRRSTITDTDGTTFPLTEGDLIGRADPNRPEHLDLLTLGILPAMVAVNRDGFTHAPTLQFGLFYGSAVQIPSTMEFEPLVNHEMHATLERERGVSIRVVPGISKFRLWVRMNPHIASMLVRSQLLSSGGPV